MQGPRVSWFLAQIYDRFMRRSEEEGLAAWREELLRPLEGSVLEIGAGTGANLRFYPTRVRRLVLAEPDRHMRTILERCVRESGRTVELVDAPGERLPFADATFDFVVSTLVLCSVKSLETTLS